MVEPTAREIFGTDEPVPRQRLLSAGPLTATLEDGNLRYIRFGGIEVIRAINYLARSGSWATYAATLADMRVTETPDRFEVGYDANCGDGDRRLTYRMTIEGTADGRLTMQADAVALTDFETNRTGFVVLHPGHVAGDRLSITHTDGRVEETAFPLHIMADQPAFDIAALAHEPAPGLTCTVRMTGDAFEMEDQRNWTDASFKTYVRPLSRPRPYVIPRGAYDRQAIEMEIGGSLPVPAATRQKAQPIQTAMPSIALFADETVPASGYEIAPGLAGKIILRLDPRADPAAFLFAAEAASKAGLEPCVEIVFDALDIEAEARGSLARIADAGMRPTAILASCRRDFKTRPSASLPRGEANVSDVLAALRHAGFDGRIGAGTPSNFTEFNRNPPPRDCDFIYFAIAATVHAADDVSVIETLEAYPAVVDSARTLCPGKPIWLVPCTLAPRHNPYGAALAPNSANGRVPAAETDPRHGALFGAAFAIGIAAVAAESGIETLSLAAPAGTFGLAGGNGQANALAAVHSVLSSAAGSRLVEMPDLHPHCRGVAWERNGQRHMLLANLSPADARIDFLSSLTMSKLAPRGWTAPQGPHAAAIGPYGSMLIACEAHNS